MKFELKPNNRNASDQDLIDDIKKVVKEFNKETITRDEYDQKGRFNSATIRKRFKGWLNALQKAGLSKTINYNDPNDDLLKNIEDVWVKLGRQPSSKEMKPPLSKYWAATYERRFGTWRKGLEEFIEYINSDDDKNDEPLIEEIIQEKESKPPPPKEVALILQPSKRG